MLAEPAPPPLRRGGLLRLGFTEAGVCVSPLQTCGTVDWGDTTGGLEDGPAHGHLRQKCRAPGEGGGPGHGPSPRDLPAKRRPVGSTWRLGAHTRETASPFPWGGGGPCPKWIRRSASRPIPCPWEGIRLRVGRVHARSAGQETRGGDKEESRRHDA